RFGCSGRSIALPFLQSCDNTDNPFLIAKRECRAETARVGSVDNRLWCILASRNTTRRRSIHRRTQCHRPRACTATSSSSVGRNSPWVLVRRVCADGRQSPRCQQINTVIRTCFVQTLQRVKVNRECEGQR